MGFGAAGMFSGAVRLFAMSLEAADKDAVRDRQGCHVLNGEPGDRRSFGIKNSNLTKQGISLLCRRAAGMELAWNILEMGKYWFPVPAPQNFKPLFLCFLNNINNEVIIFCIFSLLALTFHLGSHKVPLFWHEQIVSFSVPVSLGLH